MGLPENPSLVATARLRVGLPLVDLGWQCPSVDDRPRSPFRLRAGTA
jgi:hypothetical protein